MHGRRPGDGCGRRPGEATLTPGVLERMRRLGEERFFPGAEKRRTVQERRVGRLGNWVSLLECDFSCVNFHKIYFLKKKRTLPYVQCRLF